MGSFSKTFASNGGFVACNSVAAKEYLRYFGSAGTFSNALSPIQSAIVLKAFEIVDSAEGRSLRTSLMQNILYLREALVGANLEVIGNPSAIVSAKVGDEALARLVSRRLPALNVVANLVEFPAVAKGSARFRLQVMAKHSKENIDNLVARLLAAIDGAQAAYQRFQSAAVEEFEPVARVGGAE
jgi:7-keto-8-aminopelargonate synthetase-like enzyme